VESLISCVDAIIHRDQQRAEPINLQCASVLTTFQTKCNVVTCAREKRRIEADLEAATVATYDQSQDTTRHEAEDVTEWTYDSDYDAGYNSDAHQCGCHSAFGKNDDGEVIHAGLNCKYRF